MIVYTKRTHTHAHATFKLNGEGRRREARGNFLRNFDTPAIDCKGRRFVEQVAELGLFPHPSANAFFLKKV